MAAHPSWSLLDVAGSYCGIVVVAHLDLLDLSRLDTCCVQLRATLSSDVSVVWRAAGEQAFLGLELDDWKRRRNISTPFATARCDWKARCRYWHESLLQFCCPVVGRLISAWRSRANTDTDANRLAFSRIVVDTNILAHGAGVYVEFEVMKNCDNLSLAVVDRPVSESFTSVTFSPELGALIMERKGTLHFSSIQFLPAAPDSFKFTGCVGVYFKDGRLAFYRRWSPDISAALRAAAKAKNTDVAPVAAAASTDVVAPAGWRPVNEEDYLQAVAALEEFEELRGRAELDERIASVEGSMASRPGRPQVSVRTLGGPGRRSSPSASLSATEAITRSASHELGDIRQQAQRV